MKLIIRIILSIICLWTMWLIFAHLMKDRHGMPNPQWVAQVLKTKSRYYSGGIWFVVSSGRLDRIGAWWWFGTGDGPGSAKAAFQWPLIVIRSGIHPMNATWINHELIHYQQCLQSACLLNLWSWWEQIWYRFQWYNIMDAYLFKTTEQEAYLNQHNFSYLTGQNLMHSLKYIPHKVTIQFTSWYQVINQSGL